MITLRKFLALPIIAILTACSTVPVTTRQSFGAYPFHHDDFDFKLAWKSSPTPQGVALEGAMQNIRYPHVEDIQLSVSLRAPDNAQRAGASTFILPLPVRQDEYRDFSLFLKNAVPSRGDTLQFLIRYRVTDDEKSSFGWITRFTVDALTGAALNPQEQPRNDR